jgi:hypothetical protein
VDDLALKVGEIDHIVIDQSNVPNPRGCQVEGNGRSEASGADDQHRGSFELALPIQPYVWDEQVARVAQDFFMG